MYITKITLCTTLLGFMASNVQGDPVQWSVADGGNDHWYQAFIVEDGLTQLEGKQRASELGGYLASITSDAETNFINSHIANDAELWVNDPNGCLCNGPWIGGQKVAGSSWEWLDDTEWGYTNWHYGNPDGSEEDSQALKLWDFSGKKWVDHRIAGEGDNWVKSFIVEWDNHQPVQWTVEEGGNDHWYQPITEPNLLWEDAQNLAISMGGYLATPTSAEENQFIYEMIEPIDSMWNSGQWNGPWLGGYQDTNAPDYVEPMGGWQWATDEIWNFTNWASNQPDDGGLKFTEDHLQYWQRDQNTWNDIHSGVLVSGLVVEFTTLPGPVLGACCINEQCLIETESICISDGGQWNGPYTECCETACGFDECLGDINGNGTVDTPDLLTVIANWGQQGTPLGDANSDGYVDVLDILFIINHWGECDNVEPFEGAIQWEVGDGGNGHWYYLMELNPPQSAEHHFATAESMGGHTVTFSSLAENEFCFNLTNNCTAPWSGPIIGVRKEEGNNQGAWITGEPWNFTNWHSGEGDNSWERYVNLWVNENQTPQWQDTDLTANAFSIVEWSD
jgi:hypothetical protein